MDFFLHLHFYDHCSSMYWLTVWHSTMSINHRHSDRKIPYKLRWLRKMRFEWYFRALLGPPLEIDTLTDSHRRANWWDIVDELYTLWLESVVGKKTGLFQTVSCWEIAAGGGGESCPIITRDTLTYYSVSLELVFLVHFYHLRQPWLVYVSIWSLVGNMFWPLTFVVYGLWVLGWSALVREKKCSHQQPTPTHWLNWWFKFEFWTHHSFDRFLFKFR